MHQKRSAAELCLESLGELTVLPRPLAGFKGEQPGRGGNGPPPPHFIGALHIRKFGSVTMAIENDCGADAEHLIAHSRPYTLKRRLCALVTLLR